MIQVLKSQIAIPGAILPLSSPIVSLKDRVVWLGPIDVKGREELPEKVTDIVVPNLLHHLFFRRAKERYPKANLWADRNVQLKHPDVPWANTLSEASWPFSEDLPCLHLKGANRLSETVFFHRASKTLLCTDLCFSLDHPQGWLAPILFRLLGTYSGFAVSRLLRSFVTNRQEFEKSLSQVLCWDFEKIIMAHGDPLEQNGNVSLRKALLQRGYRCR
jgi:hypothetical protein